MLTTLMIPLALVAAGTTNDPPMDPQLEAIVVESTFDPETACPPLRTLVPALAGLVGGERYAIDMLTAYGVEIYEDGLGRNLSEHAEDVLIELMEDCLR